jgi:uncharacterized cupin superfamily protein
MNLQENSKRKFHQLSSAKTGENYSLSNVISNELMAKDIFMSHEIILPNSRSSAPHFHTSTEEIIYIIKGSVKAVEGKDEFSLTEGDVILFEPNSQKHHFIKNESDVESHILVIRKKMTKPDAQF